MVRSKIMFFCCCYFFSSEENLARQLAPRARSKHEKKTRWTTVEFVGRTRGARFSLLLPKNYHDGRSLLPSVLRNISSPKNKISRALNGTVSSPYRFAPYWTVSHCTNSCRTVSHLSISYRPYRTVSHCTILCRTVPFRTVPRRAFLPVLLLYMLTSVQYTWRLFFDPQTGEFSCWDPTRLKVEWKCLFLNRTV